jgi:hypothetical protein
MREESGHPEARVIRRQPENQPQLSDVTAQTGMTLPVTALSARAAAHRGMKLMLGGLLSDSDLTVA